MAGDETHRIDRDDCFICSRGNPDILERHHIVPKRFGGSDSDENVVDLCPSCHRALESLYDQRFWTAVGAVSEQRQLDYIIDDIAERLTKFELEVSHTVSNIQSELNGEYKDADVEAAKQRARKRHLNNVEQNLPELTQSPENFKEFAAVLANNSGGNGQITVDEAVQIGTSNGLEEPEVVNLIEGIKDYGFGYEPESGTIKVLLP